MLRFLIIGSGQGTVSNEEGQFEFRKLPAGKYKLRVSAVGYKTQEKEVTVSKDFTAVIHFPMEEESFMTDEVVVSANRNEVSRKAAPVVVNVMSTKIVRDGQLHRPCQDTELPAGLRVENNCQNCGFPPGAHQWLGRSVFADIDKQPSHHQCIERCVRIGANPREHRLNG